MRDIHIKVTPEDYDRLTRMCLHKGDMTYLLQVAVHTYLDAKEAAQAKEDEILRSHVDV